MGLSETEEENPFFIVGMVGALRFKGKSYEEIAAQLKFDSVEEMRNRLESLQLPGWFVGAETSSDKKRVREKSTPRLREVGPAKDLPPAGNATELFKERLEALLEDDLRECGESRIRQHRRRSLLRLRCELASQDLPIGPQGAQIPAVDLRLHSASVAGPDAQRVAPLKRSRETGLGDSLVGDRAVGLDLQPRGGAAYAHRRSDAVLGALLRPGGVFAIRVRARRFEKR